MSATNVANELIAGHFRTISHGKHPPDGEACVMEIVAYDAGEEWTDSPRCVAAPIRGFMVTWNDALPDTPAGDVDRVRLFTPLLPYLAGTGPLSDEQSRGIYMMACDWQIREWLPVWLRLAHLDSHADAVAALEPFTD
ncbi:MAG: hypothetical protein ACREB9_08540, partial [Thermoplasmata archaeon]